MTVGDKLLQKAIDAFSDAVDARVSEARKLDDKCPRAEVQAEIYLALMRDLAEALADNTPALKEGLTRAGFIRVQSASASAVTPPKRQPRNPKVDLAIFEYANAEINGFYDAGLFKNLQELGLEFKVSTVRTKLSRYVSGAISSDIDGSGGFLERLGGGKSGHYKLTDRGRKQYARLKTQAR
jgi:hypothetical protein